MLEPYWSGIIWKHQQAPSHPEMNDQRQTLAQRNRKVFAAPLRTAECLAADQGLERVEVHVADDAMKIMERYAGYLATDGLLFQDAADCLDFGEFWHTLSQYSEGSRH